MAGKKRKKNLITINQLTGKTLSRQTVIFYLLIVFIATNMIKQNTSKKMILIIICLSMIIFYLNIYLGLIFISLIYLQTSLIPKEKFNAWCYKQKFKFIVDFIPNGKIEK